MRCERELVSMRPCEPRVLLFGILRCECARSVALDDRLVIQDCGGVNAFDNGRCIGRTVASDDRSLDL